MYVGSLPSGKSDSSSVAVIIGGAVSGTILFIFIAGLFIIMLWCVRLSHKKKAYPINKNSLQFIANTVKLESEAEAELNVVTHDASRSTKAKMKIGQDDFDYVRPIDHEPVPDHNKNLGESIKMDANPSYGLATNINDVKPGDYDYVVDHSIQHSKVNSTQTQYLMLYHTDPDATIKMDVNPSYGLAMQDVNTIEAGVKNDYDYVDDGSIHHPSHRNVLNKSITRKSEDEYAVYGPVNQPMSDVAPEEDDVNQPLCDS